MASIWAGCQVKVRGAVVLMPASLPLKLVVALVVFAVLVAEPVSKLGPEVMGARHIVG
jgi:hypothetical protein